MSEMLLRYSAIHARTFYWKMLLLIISVARIYTENHNTVFAPNRFMKNRPQDRKKKSLQYSNILDTTSTLKPSFYDNVKGRKSVFKPESYELPIQVKYWDRVMVPSVPWY